MKINQIICINSPNDFEKLKYRSIFKIVCKKCGKEEIFHQFHRNRMDRYSAFLCRNCSNNENRNYDEIFEKIKETNLKNLGVEFPFQSNEIQNKGKLKRKELYGVENYTNREKAKETTKKNYGVENIFYSKEFQESVIDYWKRTKGVNTYLKTDEYNKYMIDKYGADYPTQNNDIKDTKFNRYEYESFLSLNILQEIVRKDRLNNPEKYISKRIFYCGLSFDSIPEFCVFIYCMDAWIPITRNYSIGFDYIDNKGNVHKAFPDFIINGKLIEIKGAHFFKEDGTMYLPYRKPEWSDEKYNYMCDLYERKRQCLINNGVLIYKDTDPWIAECIRYVYFTYGKNWINLFSKSNPLNICYGYSPFNINSKEGYISEPSINLSPFYLRYNCIF